LKNLPHAENIPHHILENQISFKKKTSLKQYIFQRNTFGTMLMELTISLRSRINIFHLIVDLAGLKLQPQYYLIELRLSEELNGQILTFLLKLLFLAHKKDLQVILTMDVMEVKLSTLSSS